MQAFDDQGVDPETCLRNAARFDVQSFRAGILDEIAAAERGRPRGLDPARRLDPEQLVPLAAQATRR